MMRAEHLAATRAAIELHETIRDVVDHAGKCPVSARWRSDLVQHWERLIAYPAAFEYVTCKLSRLTTLADHMGWAVDDLRPFVDHLLACFGPARLIFESDWPVSRRAREYAETVASARPLVEELPDTERRQILEGTARRLYRLPETR